MNSPKLPLLLALSAALCGCVPTAAQQASAAGASSSDGLAGVEALFPAGSKVLDSRPLGSGPAGSMAVLASLPGQPIPPASTAPPMAELAVVNKTPSGWHLEKAVIQDFAQAPKLDPPAQIDGAPAVGFEYSTGANSQGLLVLRNDAVVFDAVADGFQFEDLDHDGTAEVVKSWSPFCQSHVASPRLNTVYAWENGAYAIATSHFPQIIAQDTASFQAAVARASSAQTTPAWSPKDEACLHDALGYLADLSGNSAQAAAEYAQVKQLDPSYDPRTIQSMAAGR